MKVADVTGVAWQQMCVSSWQGLAASPVIGGGWTYSSLLGSLCFCFVCVSDALGLTADVNRKGLPYKVNVTCFNDNPPLVFVKNGVDTELLTSHHPTPGKV